VRAGRARALRSRGRLSPLLRVRRGDPGLPGRGVARFDVRDGLVGHRAEPVDQPDGPGPPAGGADRTRNARGRDGRPACAARERSGTRVHRRRVPPVRRRRHARPADAHERLRAGHGRSRHRVSCRHRGEDLPRDRARRGRTADRQELRQPAPRGSGAGTALHGPTGAPGARALHHPLVRRPGARGSGCRGGPTLCGHRAVRRARAAHALPHVHPRGAVERVGGDERAVDGGRRARFLAGGAAPRGRLHDVRAPPAAARFGRRRAAAADPRDRGAIRSGKGDRRRARLRRRVRARGDARTVRARAAGLGRGGRAPRPHD
jgi:hypothetical protein